MSILRRGFENLVKAPNRERLPATPTFGDQGLFTGSGIGFTTGQVPQMAAYSASGTLFSVVSLVDQAVASVEWTLGRRGRDGQVRDVPNHPALDIWNNISPFDTGRAYREAGQQHQELTGEWWTVIIRDGRGQPVELQLVRPDRMRPIPDRGKFIKGYIYTLGTERIPLEVEDVLFMKLPNPMDPYRGLGPVQALLVDLDEERMVGQWQRNFFANSAEPGGIIQLDDELDDAQWDQFVKRWRETHQGVQNAHRVAILERGKWVDRKVTQREMQLVTSREFTRDLILWTYRISPAMLGITTDVNRANAEAAEVVFARWTVRPRLDRIKCMLNEQYLPMFPGSEGLEFDYEDPVPSDRMQDAQDAVAGYGAGILKLNEARQRFGEDEVDKDEGGDEFKSSPAPAFALNPAPNDETEPPEEDEDDVAKGFRRVALKAADPSGLIPESLEEAEARIQRNWARRLFHESNKLALFAADFMTRSAISKLEAGDLDSYDWDWWEKYSTEVIAEIESATAIALATGFPEMAPGIVELVAGQYARQRGAELLRLDGDANLVKMTRIRVNSLVATAVEEGQGLGTLQKALRDDFCFSVERSRTVARTETATALGEGGKRAAANQNLDEKQWITQGDDHVDKDGISGPCLDNERQGWIRASDVFVSGDDTVPNHPNCRCTVIYRDSKAAISGTDPAEGLADDISAAIEGSRSINLCPDCKHRVDLGKFTGIAEVWCGHCKAVKTFSNAVNESIKVVEKFIERDEHDRIIRVREEYPNG